ncbi:MAG: quinone-dependent dihydroorotate dehydrogenase [Candidatus Competibacteraceae bacterium]|nr:quinone-dependent dihydroorotate dehydrogenase [Candidatus Competibacteraceae bacterium]MBK7984206.1 quinone-dependent dihydroorotate dehydrogenase [Candidatus Competibacteraceae bacterium]MBK8896176.1 quinone-dependent dihydroorotate dehydrogenase [Candidatus Competibacteraceae bacterium]MBK8965017.1 quinone-dependent dihydroorotate dehydrogenase [Candidatus Competibacteraceae bacterium]MBK9950297.1 quinone-dependent dihydroorotate dehydrogenase [Candidatus Competibacteraceae bacterium]
MFYPALRFLLFQLDPETAHDRALFLLRQTFSSPLGKLGALLPIERAGAPRRVMGLDFPNPVGLAAGLDKNGECIRAWQTFGFGFVEIGTVTPRPQPGNPKPRLFRLPEAKALINRMGFNNKGVDYLIERVKRSDYQGVLGINIGKNADTPVERAADDYLIGLRKVYPWASYITVNISSPNTPGLRDLQYGAALDRLLESLKNEQRRLAGEHGRYTPLALKIAPDLADTDLTTVARALLQHEIDAVIATNTTFSRTGVERLTHSGEAGGLSGAPLRDRSTTIVRQLADNLAGKIPIIAAGGILSGADAAAKIAAGASLVQLYTGFIYRGPELVRETVAALR